MARRASSLTWLAWLSLVVWLGYATTIILVSFAGFNGGATPWGIIFATQTELAPASWVFLIWAILAAGSGAYVFFILFTPGACRTDSTRMLAWFWLFLLIGHTTVLWLWIFNIGGLWAAFGVDVAIWISTCIAVILINLVPSQHLDTFLRTRASPRNAPDVITYWAVIVPLAMYCGWLLVETWLLFAAAAATSGISGFLPNEISGPLVIIGVTWFLALLLAGLFVEPHGVLAVSWFFLALVVLRYFTLQIGVWAAGAFVGALVAGVILMWIRYVSVAGLFYRQGIAARRAPKNTM